MSATASLEAITQLRAPGGAAGSVKPVSREADEAKRSGLTDLRIAGQSGVVMAAVHATVPTRTHKGDRGALVEGKAGGGDRRPPQSEFRACARSTYRTQFPGET